MEQAIKNITKTCLKMKMHNENIEFDERFEALKQFTRLKYTDDSIKSNHHSHNMLIEREIFFH